MEMETLMQLKKKKSVPFLDHHSYERFLWEVHN